MGRKKRGGYHSNTEYTSSSTYDSDDCWYFDDSDDSHTLLVLFRNERKPVLPN